MNKLIITIVTTVLLSASGIALAKDFNRDHGKKGQRGMQAMPVAGQIMRAIKQLDLDEEQQANIKAEMQALKTRVHPIMLETKAGHKQLGELVKAESFDEEAVAAVAKKEGDLAAQRIMLTGEALSRVFGYLTPEQREQLEAMATERKKQRAERREGSARES